MGPRKLRGKNYLGDCCTDSLADYDEVVVVDVDDE